MLVKQISPGTAVVSLKELGTNCWHPCRFIKDDGRCDRIFTCSYLEKKRCQAIHAEIAHLKKEQVRLINQGIQIDHTIEMLTDMLKK